MVVKDGPDRIRELIRLGVRFNIKPSADTDDINGEELDLGREGGHSQNRIVHAQDMTGEAVEQALIRQIQDNDRIRVYENHVAIDLITYSTRVKRGLVTTTFADHCCGAYVFDRSERSVKTFCSKITLLATGGAGKVYLYTSNPDIATGDGIAMGYRPEPRLPIWNLSSFIPHACIIPKPRIF